ncbi:hypothetical protein, partial [Streptomyces microflavus]|uniref:hypothetical protein n=1 Tax=Streptomyces microflavus TaxID=1919 RepID=UPI00363AFC76
TSEVASLDQGGEAGDVLTGGGEVAVLVVAVDRLGDRVSGPVLGGGVGELSDLEVCLTRQPRQ